MGKTIAWFIGLIVSIGAAITVIKSLYDYFRATDKRHEEERNERAQILEKLQMFLDGQSYSNTVQKTMLNILGVRYFKTDLNGYSIETSESLCRLVGYSESELKGMNWSSKIVEKDKPRVYEEFSRAVKYGTDYDCTYGFVCGTGEIIKLRVVCKKTPINYFGTVNLIE